MQVVFGKNTAEQLKNNFTVLELDTFMQEGLQEPITAYAVLAFEDLPLDELSHLEHTVKLHNTMWVEYRAKRFKYCEDAMEHLRGKWKGALDSFYEDFGKRIAELKNTNLSEDWNGVIYKN